MSLAGEPPPLVSIAVTATQLPALQKLFSECAASLSAGDPGPHPAKRHLDALAAPNCHVLLARRGPVPLGCVALVDQLRFGELSTLYVRQDHRHQGIARGLVAEAELLAGEIGLSHLRLEAGHGQEAAVALYRSMGYGPCAALRDHPAGNGVLCLEKRLF